LGGIGSGKYNKCKTKPTLASYINLDLRKVLKLIKLDRCCGFTLEWSKNDIVTSSVDCIFENNILELYYSLSKVHTEKSIVDRIELTATPCYFGGKRKWFICPECDRKALILYAANRFRCRKCVGCYHPSSNEGELYRATRAMCNIQNKLNGLELSPMEGVNGISKPKWMKWQTKPEHVFRW